MAYSEEEIKNSIQQYLADEIADEDEADTIDDDTDLLADGILDSITTVKLVSFLEERYSIKLQAHDMDSNNFSSLNDITHLVISKLG